MQSFARHLLLPAFVLVGLLVQIGCQADLTAEEYVASARDYQDKGNLSEAVIQVKNALRKDPNSAEGRFVLGRIHLDLGDAADAESQLRRAVELGLAPQDAEVPLARALLLQGKYQQVIESDVDQELVPAPDRAELLALRGDAYLAIGEANIADEFYNEALSIEENSPRATTGKARLLLVRNDRDAAKTQLLATLEAAPDFAAAWRLLGQVELRDGNLAEAEDSFTRAIQNTVYSVDSLYSRALIRIRLNKLDEAKKDIKALRQKLNRNLSVDYAEGLLLFEQGNISEAQTRFAAVLGANPEHGPSLFWGGVANTRLGHLTLAESQLQRYLAINPADNNARKLLAQVQLASGNPAEAEKLALQVLQEVPDDVASMNLLADISGQLGNLEAAADYYSRVAAARPGSPSAQVYMANALVSMGEADEGLRTLQEVTELFPQSGEAAQALVQQHLSRGDFDAALKTARDFRDRDPDSAAPYVSLGLVHLRRKESEQASDAFQRVLEIEPGNPSAHQGLAVLAIGQRDYDSAEAHYLAVLKGRPDELQTLMNLAKLKALKGDQEARKAYLEQAVAGNPEAVAPRLALGQLYMQAGDAAGAINMVDAVLSRHQDDKNLLGLLAEAQLAERQFGPARDTLTRLAALAPRDARVQFYLARANEGLQDREQMRAALESSVALDPAYLPPIIGLARVAVQDGNIAEAESWVAQARKLVEADDADLIVVEAELFELNKDWANAASAYRKLLAIGPGSVTARRLARALWNAGDREGAVREYEQWLGRFPQDVLARLELSQRYQSLGRTQEAISSYQSALEIAPENVAVLNNLAFLLADTDPEKALAYARQAYQLAPENPAVLDTLAETLVRTGDLQRAAKMVERALAIQPDNPSFRYRSAQILEAQGRRKEAAETLDEILSSGREFGERGEAEAMLARLQAGS